MRKLRAKCFRIVSAFAHSAFRIVSAFRTRDYFAGSYWLMGLKCNSRIRFNMLKHFEVEKQIPR